MPHRPTQERKVADAFPTKLARHNQSSSDDQMNDSTLRKDGTPSFSGQELTDTESGDEEDPDIPRVAQWVGESELLSDLGDESALENENNGVGVNKKQLVRSVTLSYIHR